MLENEMARLEIAATKLDMGCQVQTVAVGSDYLVLRGDLLNEANDSNCEFVNCQESSVGCDNTQMATSKDGTRINKPNSLNFPFPIHIHRSTSDGHRHRVYYHSSYGASTLADCEIECQIEQSPDIECEYESGVLAQRPRAHYNYLIGQITQSECQRLKSI
jgi:hypothetical protein